MEEILGKKFPSFDHFDECFTEICTKNKEVFYRISGKLLSEKQLSKMNNEDLKFSYMLYNCEFDKERQSKSRGKRKSL